ncbi:MAG: ABC transporter ATP-binding protein [Bacillota bacterium]|jgi:energy-coupling factor transporter ATP-binding protein EcfA2
MLEPVVDIKELSFTYNGSHYPALDRINLKVHRGEFLTISGASGCGKSTLALCLAGFIPYAFAGKMEGSVRIEGKDTKDYPAGGLSGIVGLVQQDPEAQLCTLTVRDEVAFGPENLCFPPAEIRERVSFALDAVGARDLLERQVHTLSGGEKQRVAIASVLAMTPSLLILDEPTANLDPSCTGEVLRTLEKLRKDHDISIIVIEHRLERLLPITDLLLFMEKGRITRTITPQEYQELSDSKGRAFAGPSEERSQLFCDKKEGSAPLLSVENLSVSYEEKEILAQINFKAYPGETIALMGDNGSGKTTLLQVLLGVIKPGAGKIYLDRENITKLKVSRRAHDMGLSFQNPNHQIFENTVFKEALLPSLFLSKEAPELIQGKIDLLLENFGLNQYRNKNPFTLSLGEKKRLTLISVLAYSPKVLILDEPLVGQDSERIDLLVNALREHRAQGGLTLMVCHEPNVVVSCCQRVLFLEKGKLLLDASVDEAMETLAGLGKEEYLPSGYYQHGKKEKI